jgi:hypothetical protein
MPLVFRTVYGGRYLPESKHPGRLGMADATTWPGIPIAACPDEPEHRGHNRSHRRATPHTPATLPTRPSWPLF